MDGHLRKPFFFPYLNMASAIYIYLPYSNLSGNIIENPCYDTLSQKDKHFIIVEDILSCGGGKESYFIVCVPFSILCVVAR